jgi:hypothetical protein
MSCTCESMLYTSGYPAWKTGFLFADHASKYLSASVEQCKTTMSGRRTILAAMNRTKCGGEFESLFGACSAHGLSGGSDELHEPSWALVKVVQRHLEYSLPVTTRKGSSTTPQCIYTLTRPTKPNPESSFKWSVQLLRRPLNQSLRPLLLAFDESFSAS